MRGARGDWCYRTLVGVVFATGAYLCLVNLDHVGLWHDEADTAVFARNLLKDGRLTGWDGRNLAGGANARSLNERLEHTLPPVMYWVTAGSFAVFGLSDWAARLPHALLGIMGVWIAWMVIRRHVRPERWTALVMLGCITLSPQLILYSRQARYYALMAVVAMATMYLYEQWWRRRKAGWLVALGLTALAGCMNHYTSGTAMIGAIALTHLAGRAERTSASEWIMLAVAGMAPLVLLAGYLAWVGAIGGERSGFEELAGHLDGRGEIVRYGGWLEPVLRSARYCAELVRADWLPWAVLGWVGWETVRKRWTRGDDHAGQAMIRIAGIGLAYTAISGAISVQAWGPESVVALRYYMPALMIASMVTGYVVSRCWSKGPWSGAILTGLVLTTSASPYAMKMDTPWLAQTVPGLRLPRLVKEIHRPYPEAAREVGEFLNEEARADETVRTGYFGDREALIWYAGERILTCCMLDEEARQRHPELSRLPAYLDESREASWIADFGWKLKENPTIRWENYVRVWTIDDSGYPWHRPEWTWHKFTPIAVPDGVVVWGSGQQEPER